MAHPVRPNSASPPCRTRPPSPCLAGGYGGERSFERTSGDAGGYSRGGGNGGGRGYEEARGAGGGGYGGGGRGGGDDFRGSYGGGGRGGGGRGPRKEYDSFDLPGMGAGGVDYQSPYAGGQDRF